MQEFADRAELFGRGNVERPWHLSVRPTCALVLQTLAVVSLLTDAVVLAGVCATLAAGHHVAAVLACFTQRGAAGQILLDVAACGEV